MQPTTSILTEKQILVTRSGNQQQGLVEQLQAHGARVLTMPMLEITAPDSWAALDQALSELPSFQWLLLTSTNAVQFFMQRLIDQGLAYPALADLKIAVVGEKTRQALAQHGLQPALIPTRFDSEGLLEVLEPVMQSGERFLFPRVESGGREELVFALEARGAQVIQVAAYESRAPLALTPDLIAAFAAAQVDIVTFTSSKTVQHFIDLAREIDLSPVTFAAIGPQTAQTCRDLLGRVEIEATTFTLEGLVEAVVDHYR